MSESSASACEKRDVLKSRVKLLSSVRRSPRVCPEVLRNGRQASETAAAGDTERKHTWPMRLACVFANDMKITKEFSSC